MYFTLQTFTVHKRFALTISRGTTAQTTNILLCLEAEGIESWGEASPFSLVQEKPPTTEELLQQFEQIIPSLEKFHPCDRQSIESILEEAQVASSVRAAIDVALHDWLGKSLGLPLWRLWGLNRERIVATSVTIGINSAEGARERTQDWLKTMNAQVLKVKLGNYVGIEADQAMLLAVREAAPTATLTVDANGGWNLADAVKMCDWLANQGVKYVEQPLAVGDEENLKLLYPRAPLPIFIDESCLTSRDIPRLADCVHGINIKLMKAGGLSEAMRMVHVAKACGLQVMYGCYSDSSLANTAMAHLSPLADYLDLDSHLNLSDDPFQGVSLEAGRLMPNELPGLGVRLKQSTT